MLVEGIVAALMYAGEVTVDGNSMESQVLLWNIANITQHSQRLEITMIG